MSNSRKIKILADAANLGSAKNIETNDLVNFRRGDSLEIQAAFFENGKICDMSNAVSATLEVLDIGGFNAVNPREVSLLMRSETSDFSALECPGGASDLPGKESLHASFLFSQNQTSIAAGEKWIRIFADFNDGSRVTFASGWIVVSENYSSEPNLAPIENPVYYTKAQADEIFLAASRNLGDLPSAASARGNLDVYSKAETQALVNGAAAGSHTHSNYLEKSSNLADVANAAAALQNIGGVSSAEFGAYKDLSDLQIGGLGQGQAALQNSASALWLSKKPCASIGFYGGRLATKNISWTNGCYSFCFNLRLDEAPAQSAEIIEAGGSLGNNFMKVAAGASGLELSVKLGSKTYAETFEYSGAGFVFGRFNSVVCVFDCNSKRLKLFVGGVRIEIENNSSGEWGEWSDFSAQCVVGGGAEAMSIAGVKIFNADLSGLGFCYGVRDFLEGGREADFLLKAIHRNADCNLGATTSGGWSGTKGTRGVWTGGLYVSYVSNADLSEDVEAANLGISNAVDLTTQYYGFATGHATGGMYNNSLSLKDFAGKTVAIHLSFCAKKTQNIALGLGIFADKRPDGVNAIAIKEFPPSAFAYNQWVRVDETVSFAVPEYAGDARVGFYNTRETSLNQSAGAFRIANFVFEIAGAVASFEPCGNSNELKDASLNQNDAFASGGVRFEENANPAHCREALSWAGTMATQEGFVDIPENSAVRIFAKSSASTTLSASINSVSKTAALNANTLAEIGEWIAGAGASAEFSPSALLAGKIDIFYKIERL